MCVDVDVVGEKKEGVDDSLSWTRPHYHHLATPDKTKNKRERDRVHLQCSLATFLYTVNNKS